MLTLVKAGSQEKQLDSLVDSWFNKTPTVSNEELQSIQLDTNAQPAPQEERSSDAGRETTEVAN